MKRTTLFSLVVIGAVLSVVFASGTFAPFTDTDTISGGVKAATADINLKDDVAAHPALVFDTAALCQNLTDDEDDVCATDFTVTNGGTIELTYSGTVVETGDTNSCFEATLTLVTASDTTHGIVISDDTSGDPDDAEYARAAADLGGTDDADDSLDPAQVDTFNLAVALVSDAANCQAATATYTVNITGTQSASPQD